MNSYWHVRVYYIALFIFVLSAKGLSLFAQGRTIIEFYTEKPAVSDLIIDVESYHSNLVEKTALGWKVFPGQTVRIVVPYPPPQSEITELRLGYDWSGGVISAVFQGFSDRKGIYKTFEEYLFPNENQKRMFTSLQSRSYEFKITTNFHPKSEDTYLLLQSLILFWEPIPEKSNKPTQDNEQ